VSRHDGDLGAAGSAISLVANGFPSGAAPSIAARPAGVMRTSAPRPSSAHEAVVDGPRKSWWFGMDAHS
jgi:hypothetical protein